MARYVIPQESMVYGVSQQPKKTPTKTTKTATIRAPKKKTTV